MASWKGWKQWVRYRNQEMEIRNLAVGMNSTVDLTQDLHIIMLDYDIDEQIKVEESIQEAQDFWGLSDCYIFKTEHGFHAFFWYDLVPYDRLKMIIAFAKYVDPMYKYISRFYDHKTIRVAGKYKHKDIKFVKIIPGVREPSPEEQQIGMMKRQEHTYLLG